ncbi:hypothetical protein P7K49_027313 [Saguinus oedipus]|uniref:Uncharacterized protein n=1 Tax=Saguinus oedipus TaxID=9490 RepID=A0ABQ9U952_SAGOE|nr:hypothetical protein P7K49_027313 [Saguinus oedipus]
MHLCLRRNAPRDLLEGSRGLGSLRGPVSRWQPPRPGLLLLQSRLHDLGCCAPGELAGIQDAALSGAAVAVQMRTPWRVSFAFQVLPPSPLATRATIQSTSL